jgi:hypothetical protein
LPLLFKSRLVQTDSDPLAEIFNRFNQSGHLSLAVRLSAQLFLLAVETGHSLF